MIPGTSNKDEPTCSLIFYKMFLWIQNAEYVGPSHSFVQRHEYEFDNEMVFPLYESVRAPPILIYIQRTFRKRSKDVVLYPFCGCPQKGQPCFFWTIPVWVLCFLHTCACRCLFKFPLCPNSFPQGLQGKGFSLVCVCMWRDLCLMSILLWYSGHIYDDFLGVLFGSLESKDSLDEVAWPWHWGLAGTPDFPFCFCILRLYLHNHHSCWPVGEMDWLHEICISIHKARGKILEYFIGLDRTIFSKNKGEWIAWTQTFLYCSAYLWCTCLTLPQCAL